MTIDELLRAMSGAFRGFDERALESWGPALRKELARHEGPVLRDAWLGVLAGFKPGPRQAFPVPIDFAPHLPGPHPQVPAQVPAGPLLDLAAHAERKARLIAGWRERQRPRIEAARGTIIADACEWEAERLAHERAWSDTAGEVVLTAEQIALCEGRAISQWRMQHFRLAALRPGGEALWAEQMAAVRAALYANQDPTKLDAPSS